MQGLNYGGKKNIRDKKKYKPKYIDIYSTQQGDTLESIAIKEKGDKRHALEIAVLNGIKESSYIKKDMLIKIIKNGAYNQKIQHQPF